MQAVEVVAVLASSLSIQIDVRRLLPTFLMMRSASRSAAGVDTFHTKPLIGIGPTVPFGIAGRGWSTIGERSTGFHQPFPTLRWIAAIEHLGEHGIGVALRAIGPQCFAVIDPGEDDDLGAR